MKAPPNILLFLTDDHAPWTLPAYGNRALAGRLPNLDRLAREGARFDDAITPNPVSSPARACIHTGLTPSQTGIHDWLYQADPEIDNRQWLPPDIKPLASLLRTAGYRTLLSGKYHLGQSSHTPTGFDQSIALRGTQGHHNGEHHFTRHDRPWTTTGNKTRIITDNALALLDDAIPAARPFFLNIGYIATHSPYVTAAHDPATVAIARQLSQDEFPPWVPAPRAKMNEGTGDLPPSPPTPATLRDLRTGYYAAVLEIDHAIGRVLEKLESTGQLQNTLVIYVSDHGCSLGQHGIVGKGNATRPLNMYETSIRVPLLMRGPGVKPGHVATRTVDHYDLFRALCEYARVPTSGLRLPPGYGRRPGRSLAPLARGETPANWPQTRYGEYGDLRMIRTAPDGYKYIRRHDHVPDELYDLATDPGETRNLASDTARASLRGRLSARLANWYSRHQHPARSGLLVTKLPIHNPREAWRDGLRAHAPSVSSIPSVPLQT
jgi:arylsulfatase A-like enzyme